MIKNLNVKGMEIEIDSNEFGTLITAKGEYNHEIEIAPENDSISFTWSCEKDNETLVLINDGVEIKSDISSFRTFLEDYFPVNNDEYDIDTNILKEIIIIMESFF